jgi:hypothetical protein
MHMQALTIPSTTPVAQSGDPDWLHVPSSLSSIHPPLCQSMACAQVTCTYLHLDHFVRYVIGQTTWHAELLQLIQHFKKLFLHSGVDLHAYLNFFTTMQRNGRESVFHSGPSTYRHLPYCIYNVQRVPQVVQDIWKMVMVVQQYCISKKP